MNLYFYAPESVSRTVEASVQDVLSMLKNTTIHLSTNRGERIDLGGESRQELEARGASLLEAMHALMLEGSTADPQLGYLFAFALTQRLPLLLLVSKGSDPALLTTLAAHKLPKHVMVSWYTPDTLHSIVEQFLGRLAKITIKESPDIKFTLRLTRTEERYLEYRTRGSKKRKADFLRELLDGHMTDDEQFRSWLRKRQQ